MNKNLIFRVRVLRVTLLASTLALGAGLGVGVSALTSGASTGVTAPSNPGNFPTNANGQTYGSSSNVSLENEPDLIYAIATNGAVGYISRSQLWAADGTNVQSPAQAANYMASATSPRFIPVYESDGSTIVGQFEISGTNSSTSGQPIPPDFPKTAQP